MSTFASDEEQIEALQKWWKENGNSLLIGVGIVLVVFFGGRAWQSARLDVTHTASDLYQQIADTVIASPELEVETIGEMIELNRQLRAEHGDTIYARFAALMMARLYVQQDNLDSAEEQLRWILDNPELGFMQKADPELALTARLRLARIQLAKGQYNEALTTLAVIDAGSMSGAYAEAQGDIYMAQGMTEEARSAYQSALDLAPAELPLLQLKLENLGN